MNIANIASEEAHDATQAASYNRRQSVCAGAVLIGAGVLSCVSEIVALVYARTDGNDDYIIYRPGIGIWAGALITAFVVFSLTAAVACLMYQFNDNVHRALFHFQIGTNCHSELLVGQYRRDHERECRQAHVLFAMEVILTVTAFVAGMSGIYGAVFICKWIYCNAVNNEYLWTTNRYNRHETVLSGSILILAGFLSIAFNSVAINIRSSLADRSSAFTAFQYELTGHGIWSGTLCILAGIIGIAAGRYKTRCKVTVFVVFSLAATVACFLYQLNYGLEGAQWESYAATAYDCRRDVLENCIAQIRSTTLCMQRRAMLAMHALMAVTAIVGGMAGIWGSVISCCSDSLTNQRLTTTTDGSYVELQSHRENASVVPNAQLQPGGATSPNDNGIVPSMSLYPRHNVAIGDANCNNTTTNEHVGTNYCNRPEVDLPPSYDVVCPQ